MAGLIASMQRQKTLKMEKAAAAAEGLPADKSAFRLSIPEKNAPSHPFQD